MSRIKDTAMTPSVEGQALMPVKVHGASRSVCPVCGDDVRTTAVVRLAYTHEPCDCPAAPYVHLTEQLWHRNHVR